jgi:PIN domain nuclease of toxin-antitoxin system
MNLLLDTHTFLWWVTDDPRLSAVARDFMRDIELLSIWETVA